jgi:hypothetical protein
MKYTLYILSILFCGSVFGQGTWNIQRVNNKINRQQVDSVFITPRDTTPTNLVVDPSTGQPVGDSGRIAYKSGKFWGKINLGGILQWQELGAGATDLSNYYTKTQLQTLGESAVHWGNITDKTFAEANGEVHGIATFNGNDFTDDGNGAISLNYTTGPIPISQKGVANGVATLDVSSKIPLSQIPESLLGAVNYQGTYNAATNTPALPVAAASNKGWYYVVSVAGTSQGLTLNPGDWVISNGSAWGKVDNNNAVTSVFGRTGAVTAQSGDYTTSQVTEGTNLYHTAARVRSAVSATAPLTFNSGTGAFGITQASSSTNGYLSSTDWTTFNNKPSVNLYTGDGSISGGIRTVTLVGAGQLKIRSSTIDDTLFLVNGSGVYLPKSATPFPIELTQFLGIVPNTGAVLSRTAAQTLSDIGGAPSAGGSGYIQNQFTAPQSNSSFWASGEGRSNIRFSVLKDGSNSLNTTFTLLNAAGNRGAGLQLNADVNPGLATWIHNGTAWVKRVENFATGLTAFYPSSGEAIRMVSDAVLLSAYNSAGTTRTGYLQFNTGGASVLGVDVNQGLSFATNGTVRQTITADGNVGIAATATERLTVGGNILANGGNGIGFTLNGPSSIVRDNSIDIKINTNRVGINNTSPALTTLDVNGDMRTTIGLTTPLIMSNASAGTVSLVGGATAAGSLRGGQIDLFGGSAASPNTGNVVFYAGTGGGGAVQPERMRINASGNVAIGSNTPITKFNVADGNGGVQFDVTPSTASSIVTFNARNGTTSELVDMNINAASTTFSGPITSGGFITNGAFTADGLGGVSAASLVVTGNTRLGGNGVPGVGKIPTGTDASGNFTWQSPANIARFGTIVTGSYTVNATDAAVIVNATGAAATVNIALPAATGANSGRIVNIYKLNTNGQSFSIGGTVLTQTAFTVVSNGSTWTTIPL